MQIAPRLASLVAVLAFASEPAFADLDLHGLFGDGMVLQRDAQAPVWGTAAPGTEVRVLGSWEGAVPAIAMADEQGHWRANVATPGAGGPYTVSVASDDGSDELSDVLVGDVWLCSGQSNMEWTLDAIHPSALDRASGELPAATLALDRPRVRFFDVPRRAVRAPEEDVVGSWKPAVGPPTLECSAVAYYFACRLEDELDIPIGLVVSAWGGTPAQAWTSEATVRRFPHYDGQLARLDESAAARNRGTDAIAEFWKDVDKRRFWTAAFRSSTFDDDSWDEQVQPAYFETGPIGEHDGVVWYRRRVEVPTDWAGSELRLQLPAIDDMDETFFEGVSIGTTVEVGGWSKPRRYVVPARLVQGGEVTITIRALDTGGPGGFADAPMRLVRGDEAIDLAGPWKVRRGTGASEIGAAPFPPAVNQNTPAALHHGMIAPLVPFALAGITWYQGESNRSRPDEYRALFPAMIVDWREAWGRDVPFYYVQIAPFNYGEGPGQYASAVVREAQAAARELPATGMALTCDIGEKADIHPKNKWDVGDRLARFALRDLHGRSDVVADGPTMRRAVPDGDSLRIEFDHVAGGLVALRARLDHFEIAAAGGEFVAATATLGADGSSVVLRAEGLERPTRARYLWSDDAEATVGGGAGLPMAPFTTR